MLNLDSKKINRFRGERSKKRISLLLTVSAGFLSEKANNKDVGERLARLSVGRAEAHHSARDSPPSRGWVGELGEAAVRAGLLAYGDPAGMRWSTTGRERLVEPWRLGIAVR